MTPTTAQLPRAVEPGEFQATLLVVAAGVAAGQSHAFGGANHRLVAELAEQQLKPAVRPAHHAYSVAKVRPAQGR